MSERPLQRRLWSPDVVINVDTVTNWLHSEYPEINFSEIRKFGEGWDSEIYLLDDHLALKITKRIVAIPFSTNEIDILPILRKQLEISIPEIILKGKYQVDFPFFAFQPLPGKITSHEHLAEHDRKKLIGPMVNFLNQLHSIPVTGEIRNQMTGDTIGRMNIAKRTAQIQEKIAVTGRLGVSFDSRVTETLLASLTQADVDSKENIVHGDLHAGNVLIDQHFNVTGIIDWGDSHLGHPARDLTFAVCFFGPQSMKEFAGQYKFYDRKTFLLALFSATSHICSISEYALDRNDERLVVECRNTFQNIQDNFFSMSEL